MEQAQGPFAGFGSQPLRSASGPANRNGPEPALVSGGGLAHRLLSNRSADFRAFHTSGVRHSVRRSKGLLAMPPHKLRYALGILLRSW